MAQNDNVSQVRGILIDSNEKIKAVLGNNWLQSFLSTGNIEDNFVVLTDKRVYFKGNGLTRNANGGFVSKKEERIVDLKDISATGIIHSKPTGLLVAGFVFLIIFVFLAFIPYSLNIGDINLFEGPSLILFFLSIITFICYFINRYSAFEINYAGGGFAFKLYMTNNNEVEYFHRQLILSKQNERANTDVYISGNN